MKTLRIHEYGGPLQLDEIEQPVADAGQVVVRNLATSFNPIDPGRPSGVMRQAFPLQLPWIPGGDVSGTVEGVGEGITNLKVGDAVFGYSMTGRAYAEFVVVQRTSASRCPSGWCGAGLWNGCASIIASATRSKKALIPSWKVATTAASTLVLRHARRARFSVPLS
jgi:NADPH:quinone reductase-like Zn-dependent oxidoreductase